MNPDSLCRWQVQVSVYCAWRMPAHRRCPQCSILLHLMDICFQTCIGLWAYIANPDLFVCGYRNWICLDITRFYEEQRQPSAGPHFDTMCTAVLYSLCFTACRMCRLEPLYRSPQHRSYHNYCPLWVISVRVPESGLCVHISGED